ncbi:DUF4241 domain-containing protein [Nocardia xishanensis]|uniref:DUF4241 domain-containing protein n=1 Tax=Nocardia xishanensis TaxID=238964 RepID=A0ABW7X0M5_9NOCA
MPYTEYRECAATRLRIRDEPVVTWELVLGVGEDPSGPPADSAGFEAEEAMGCFADATAWESLTAPFRRFLADMADAGFGRPAAGRDTEDLCEGYFELARDEEHRADLLTFGVPEGWAQVWAGRDRDGEIAVIVVPGPERTRGLREADLVVSLSCETVRSQNQRRPRHLTVRGAASRAVRGRCSGPRG